MRLCPRELTAYKCHERKSHGAHWAHSVCNPLVFLAVHDPSSPSLSLNPSTNTLLLGFGFILCHMYLAYPSTTSRWHTKCSRVSTPPSVSSHDQRCSAPCSGRMGRCSHAHARLAIGVRSCAEGLSNVWGFLECVSIILIPVFPLSKDSEWPLAGESLQGLSPSRQQASPMSGSLVVAPQVAPALTPRLLRPCSLASVVDFVTALSRQHLWLYQPSGGSASSSPLAVVSTHAQASHRRGGFAPAR